MLYTYLVAERKAQFNRVLSVAWYCKSNRSLQSVLKRCLLSLIPDGSERVK